MIKTLKIGKHVLYIAIVRAYSPEEQKERKQRRLEVVERAKKLIAEMKAEGVE